MPTTGPGPLISRVPPPQPARAAAASDRITRDVRRICGADVTGGRCRLAQVEKAGDRLEPVARLPEPPEYAPALPGYPPPSSVYCATPNPRTAKVAERGNQIPGANPAVNPREAQALL